MVGCRKKAQVKYTVSLLLLLRALGRPGRKTGPKQAAPSLYKVWQGPACQVFPITVECECTRLPAPQSRDWPYELAPSSPPRRGKEEGEGGRGSLRHLCARVHVFTKFPAILFICLFPWFTYYRHVSHFRPLSRIFAPLYLLNHGVFWSDIWTQYSFLQFRKIILMPKWRNRSKNARFLEFSKYVQNCLAQFPLGLNLQQNWQAFWYTSFYHYLKLNI